MIFSRSVTYFLLLAVLLIADISMYAYDDSPTCYKTIGRDFFDAQAVGQALSMHNYTQSAWDPIITQLHEKTATIDRRLKEAGARMKRNPLERPFQPKEARELLLKVLLEIFTETLKGFNIVNTGDIQEMFDYVLKKRERYLDHCLAPIVEKREKEEREKKEKAPQWLNGS